MAYDYHGHTLRQEEFDIAIANKRIFSGKRGSRESSVCHITNSKTFCKHENLKNIAIFRRHSQSGFVHTFIRYR